MHLRGPPKEHRAVWINQATSLDVHRAKGNIGCLLMKERLLCPPVLGTTGR